MGSFPRERQETNAGRALDARLHSGLFVSGPILDLSRETGAGPKRETRKRNQKEIEAAKRGRLSTASWSWEGAQGIEEGRIARRGCPARSIL
jgi:hypothetical protein